jgi:hypothetical protein
MCCHNIASIEFCYSSKFFPHFSWQNGRKCLFVSPDPVNANEEQYITNANDNIFLNYDTSVLSLNPKTVKNATSVHANMIATYELNYKEGKGHDIESDLSKHGKYLCGLKT